MVHLNLKAERALVRAAGLVCGGVAIVGAFRNGQSIGATSFDGLMFGSAGLAVVVMSWFSAEFRSLGEPGSHKGSSRDGPVADYGSFHPRASCRI